MINEKFEEVKPVIENFAQESDERQKEIAKNESFKNLAIEKLKERAEKIDANWKEILYYLNQPQFAKILEKYAVSYSAIANNFVNCTCFFGYAKINKRAFDNKLFFAISLTVNAKNLNFISVKEYISYCQNNNLLKSITGYEFTRTLKLVEWAEIGGVEELFRTIKYICKDLEKSERTLLQDQVAILKAVGVDTVKKVKTFRITIEEIEE